MFEVLCEFALPFRAPPEEAGSGGPRGGGWSGCSSDSHLSVSVVRRAGVVSGCVPWSAPSQFTWVCVCVGGVPLSSLHSESRELFLPRIFQSGSSAGRVGPRDLPSARGLWSAMLHGSLRRLLSGWSSS